MKDNFSLLGVGACGGNQVAAFKKYGMNSFYINSALEDLKSLGDDIHYYHLDGANGCHKNRNVSKDYLAQNYEDVLKNIERYLTGKYIFLFGSIGGGTFSGMSALLTELIESELDKIVIPVITMPNFSESLQAKTNAYEAMKELFEVNNHTIFIVDNNKELNYTKSNEVLAELIYSLISDISTSVDGIYDYSEICSMLEQEGYGILNSFSRKNQNDITSELKKAITNNIFVDIESRNSLYYCGIKSATMRKTVSINNSELQLQFGYWRDVFVGYQTKTNLIFLSGLKYPSTIIDKLYESIQNDKKKIEEDLKSSQENKSLFKDDYSIDIFTSTKEKKTLSAREKLMQMKKSK